MKKKSLPFRLKQMSASLLCVFMMLSMCGSAIHVVAAEASSEVNEEVAGSSAPAASLPNSAPSLELDGQNSSAPAPQSSAPTLPSSVQPQSEEDSSAPATIPESASSSAFSFPAEALAAAPASSHTVSILYQDRSGNTLAPSGAPASAPVNTGETYTLPSVPTLAEYVYVGYQINSSPLVETTAFPTTGSVSDDTQLIVVYGQDKVGPGSLGSSDGIEDITIQIQLEDESALGTVLPPHGGVYPLNNPVPTFKHVNIGEPLVYSPPTLLRYPGNAASGRKDYRYAGYRLNNAAITTSGIQSLVATLDMQNFLVHYMYYPLTFYIGGWSVHLAGYVFEDKNGNGVYDIGTDLPLEGMPVKIAMTTLAGARNPDTANYDRVFGDRVETGGLVAAYSDVNGFYNAELHFDVRTGENGMLAPENSGPAATPGRVPENQNYWFHTALPIEYNALFGMEYASPPASTGSGGWISVTMGSTNGSCRMFAEPYNGYTQTHDILPTIFSGDMRGNRATAFPDGFIPKSFPNGDTRTADIPMTRAPMTDHAITIKYQNRTGTALSPTGNPPYSALVAPGSTYTLDPVPSVNNYTYIGYKINDGALVGATSNPTIPNVSGPTTLTVVYGQDRTPDNKEDITLVLNWLDEDTPTTSLKPAEYHFTNIEGGFARSPESTLIYNLNNYVYVGYRIDDATVTTLGSPSFPVTLAMHNNKTVRYMYRLQGANHAVTVNYLNRDGSIAAVSETLSVPNGTSLSTTSTPPIAIKAITDKVFVDWYEGNYTGIELLKGNTTPSLTNVTANQTITLIYGQDKGGTGTDPKDPTDPTVPDEKEDVTIRLKWETESGTELKTPKVLYVNVEDSPFTRAGDAIALYNYTGYKLNTGNKQTGNPSITLAGGDAERTVTYLYLAQAVVNHTVTVKYLNRDGSQAATQETLTVANGTSLSTTSTPPIAIKTITDKVFVDWYEGNYTGSETLKGNKTPSLTNVTANQTISIIYGQDKGGGSTDPKDPTDPTVPDGKEDVTIRLKWETESGTELQPTKVLYVNVENSPFTRAADAIALYNYTGYKLNTGSKQTGNPNIALAGGDAERTVTYLYLAQPVVNHTITVKYLNRDGSQAATQETLTVANGTSLSTTSTPPIAIKTITDKVFVDWYEGNYTGIELLKGNTTPMLTNVTANQTISLVYGQDKGGTGTDPEDPSNPDLPDGKEDITLTLNWLNEANPATALKPAKAFYVNVGETFARQGEASLIYSNSTYNYAGHRINSAAATTSGQPSFTATLAMHNTQAVKYMYNQQIVNHTVTVKYLNRDGSQAATPETLTVPNGTSLSTLSTPPIAIKSITDKVFVDWYEGNYTGTETLKGNKTPSLTNITANQTISIIYGQDKGGGSTDPKDPTDPTAPDGKEDVTIRLKWETESSTELKPTKVLYVNVKDSPFTRAGDLIALYDYTGYKLNTASKQTGNPNIALAGGDAERTVTYLYLAQPIVQTPYRVTYNYNGAGATEYATVYAGDAVPRKTNPTWNDYTFGGWQADTGTLWNFTTNKMPARNLTLTAQWTKKNYTVHYLSRSTEFASRTLEWGILIPNLAPPAVDGHNFTYWALGSNPYTPWDMLTNLMPKYDIYVEALYEAVPAPIVSSSAPTSSSIPPVSSVVVSSVASSSVASSVPTSSSSSASTPPITSNSASAPNGTTSVALITSNPTSSAPPTSLEQIVSSQIDNQTGNLIEDLANGNVPLFKWDGTGVWSLLNLLLALIAFFAALLTFLRLMAYRSKKSQNSTQNEDVDVEDEVQKTQHCIPLHILTVISGLIPIILFLIRENLTTPVVWINQNTPLIALFFVLHAIIFGVLLFRARKKNFEKIA